MSVWAQHRYLPWLLFSPAPAALGTLIGVGERVGRKYVITGIYLGRPLPASL